MKCTSSFSFLVYNLRAAKSTLVYTRYFIQVRTNEKWTEQPKTKEGNEVEINRGLRGVFLVGMKSSRRSGKEVCIYLQLLLYLQVALDRSGPLDHLFHQRSF